MSRNKTDIDSVDVASVDIDASMVCIEGAAGRR